MIAANLKMWCFFGHVFHCLSVSQCACKIFTYLTPSPEPMGQFQPNCIKHHWVKKVQMSHLYPRGDNFKKNNGNDKPIVTISEGD